MYAELYEIWKRELENIELGVLPSDFYSRIANYLMKLREESRMLDKKTVRASLLDKELQNVKHMIYDQVRTRYKKLVRKVATDEKAPLNVLTVEEEKIYNGISPFAEAYRNFARNILRGHALKMDVEREHKSVVLRFLRNIPSIIGTDMKTYGPYKVEDVASLPVENAKILIKRNLAEKVEVE